MRPVHPHGLLLTGGRSRRMGAEKATIKLDGVPLAARVARALGEVADPVLVVGAPADVGLPTIDDDRRGPLGAFVAGADALRARHAAGPILLVACDLPFITSDLLAFVAAGLGEAGAAVPTLEGRDQPLAACYAAGAAAVAQRLLDQGARSMLALLEELEVQRLDERKWSELAPSEALFDVDTPDDLAAARRIGSS